jgi:hypothetical protein
MSFRVKGIYDDESERILKAFEDFRAALNFTMQVADMRLTPLAEPPLMKVVMLLDDERVELAMRVVRR